MKVQVRYFASLREALGTGEGLELPEGSTVAGALTMERPTTYADATSYNNFYEFGTGKSDPAGAAGSLKPRPWTVDGPAGGGDQTREQSQVVEGLLGMPLDGDGERVLGQLDGLDHALRRASNGEAELRGKFALAEQTDAILELRIYRLAKLEIPTIAYVSCDPDTLARDLDHFGSLLIADDADGRAGRSRASRRAHSAPTERSRRTIGTPAKLWNRSSPVSGR